MLFGLNDRWNLELATGNGNWLLDLELLCLLWLLSFDGNLLLQGHDQFVMRHEMSKWLLVMFRKFGLVARWMQTGVVVQLGRMC